MDQEDQEKEDFYDKIINLKVLQNISCKAVADSPTGFKYIDQWAVQIHKMFNDIPTADKIFTAVVLRAVSLELKRLFQELCSAVFQTTCFGYAHDACVIRSDKISNTEELRIAFDTILSSEGMYKRIMKNDSVDESITSSQGYNYYDLKLVGDTIIDQIILDPVKFSKSQFSIISAIAKAIINDSFISATPKGINFTSALREK